LKNAAKMAVFAVFYPKMHSKYILQGGFSYDDKK
jgi:hypothetical protein